MDPIVSNRQHNFDFLPLYGASFLAEHAGKIIADPQIAIVELVANAWDAGSNEVKIEWFPEQKFHLAIEDNGTGMTAQEFSYRWPHLNYNRISNQGPDVEFPAEQKRGGRKAYGRNGKGRHAMFCFSSEYFVETKRHGWKNTYRIVQNQDAGLRPFFIEEVGQESVDPAAHGTRIWCRPEFEPLPIASVRDLIGSKFIADPAFRILVNGQEVQLTDLQHLTKEYEITIPNEGTVKVLLFDTSAQSRTTKQHGVAWWVNNRLVGDVNWRKTSGEPYIDGRIGKARRYTFIVQADMLHNATNEDWTGFKQNSELVASVVTQVEDYIESEVVTLLGQSTQKKVLDALTENRSEMAALSPVAKLQVKEFADKFVESVPTVRPDVLTSAVAVMAKLEKSRSGYELLEQLSKLDNGELEQLNQLLKNWSLNEAMLILNELDRRLKLISKLETLIEDKSADELHQLQPLFEQGLWMFGPEFEAVGYTSNRQLATVLRDFLGDQKVESSIPRRRPDFVLLPDASLDVYAVDSYDERGEANGIAKVVVLELKRGGFVIGSKEIYQAMNYTNELLESGKIATHGTITAFVLGATIDKSAHNLRVMKTGPGDSIHIFAKTYSDVLRAAEARTFHLRTKIDKLRRERGGLELEWDTRPQQQSIFNVNGGTVNGAAHP